MEIYYPRIYSINTVGLRQHYHADYLLHPLRTDFIGGNGAGKSMIGDLLQLIFICRRDDWRPGTEGVEKGLRRIETLPLERPFIKFGYTFLNIEREKGKFITIGVFIQRNSAPIRPFIIQKSEDFSSTLISFNKPILASDFLDSEGHILNVMDGELGNSLQKSYGLFVKDFFRNEGIDHYHDLLYKNKIIDIDLKRQGNYNSFAKVLQSFSRAKTLNISSSRSLKDFLFEESESLKRYYEDEKERLVDLMGDYQKYKLQISLLKEKQEKLSFLKDLQLEKDRLQHDYLFQDYAISKDNFSKIEKEKNDNEEKLIKSSSEEIKIRNEISEINSKQEIIEKEVERIEKEINGISQVQALQNELSFLNTQLKSKEELIVSNNQLLLDINKKVEVKTVEQNSSPLILKNNDNLKEKEDLLIDYKRKLEDILFISPFCSKYDTKVGIVNAYQRQTEEFRKLIFNIEQIIADKKEVLSLYDEQVQNSLFSWAISEGKALNLEEESVLIHFRNLLIQEPKILTKGIRFVESPQELLKSIELTKDKKGFWVLLGEIKEYVPYQKSQIFVKEGKFKDLLEKDKETLKSEISALENRKQLILVRDEDQLKIEGFDKNFIEIPSIQKLEILYDTYLEKDSIQSSYEAISKEINDYREENGAIKERRLRIETELKEIQDSYIKHQENSAQLEIELAEILERIHKTNARIEKLELPVFELSEDILEKLDELRVKKENLRSQIQLFYKQKEIVNEQLIEVSKLKSVSESKKKSLENEFILMEDQRNKKRENYSNFIGKEISDDDNLVLSDAASLVQLRTKSITANQKYEDYYLIIINNFQETKSRGTEFLLESSFKFEAIETALLGSKIKFLDNITPELEKLNGMLSNIANLQTEMIFSVFSGVEKLYNEFERNIRDLNFFFQDRKISNTFILNIDFKPKREKTTDGKESYFIDWIRKMKERSRSFKYGRDLFSLDKPISPEELILSIVKQFFQVKDVDMAQLLNPKFYFDLESKFLNPQNGRESGSAGQAYTAIVLLCIGRLSILKEKNNAIANEGIRFVVLEEVAALDETNFRLAGEEGYQVITMNPEPYRCYTEDGWYIHMLSRGKTHFDVNEYPLSLFRAKGIREELSIYLKEEQIKN